MKPKFQIKKSLSMPSSPIPNPFPSLEELKQLDPYRRLLEVAAVFCGFLLLGAFVGLLYFGFEVLPGIDLCPNPNAILEIPGVNETVKNIVCNEKPVPTSTESPSLENDKDKATPSLPEIESIPIETEPPLTRPPPPPLELEDDRKHYDDSEHEDNGEFGSGNDDDEGSGEIQDSKLDSRVAEREIPFHESWISQVKKMDPLSIILALPHKTRPQFTHEFCYRNPVLHKFVLKVAGINYSGYGTKIKDAKKMAAQNALFQMFGGDRKLPEGPDMKALEAECGA